jgi:hypothetical protein
MSQLWDGHDWLVHLECPQVMPPLHQTSKFSASLASNKVGRDFFSGGHGSGGSVVGRYALPRLPVMLK